MKYLLAFLLSFLLTLAVLFSLPGIQERVTKRLLIQMEESFGVEVHGEVTWTLWPLQLHLNQVVFDTLQAKKVHLGLASVSIEQLSAPQNRQAGGIDAEGRWWIDFDLRPFGTLEVHHPEWGDLTFSFFFQREEKRRELCLEVAAEGQFGQFKADGSINIPRIGLKTAIEEGRSLFARFKTHWQSEQMGSALGYATIGWENLGFTLPSLEISGILFDTSFILEGSGELEHPLFDVTFFPSAGPIVEPKLSFSLYKKGEIWEGESSLEGVIDQFPVMAKGQVTFKEWQSLAIHQGSLTTDGVTGSFEAEWDFTRQHVTGTLTMATNDLSLYLPLQGDLVAKTTFSTLLDSNFFPVDPEATLHLYSHQMKKGAATLLEGEVLVSFEEKKGAAAWTFESRCDEVHLQNQVLHAFNMSAGGPLGELVPFSLQVSELLLEGQASLSYEGLHLFLDTLQGTFRSLPLSLEETACISLFKDGWNLDRLHIRTNNSFLRLNGHGTEKESAFQGEIKGLQFPDIDIPLFPLAGNFNATLTSEAAYLKGRWTGIGGEKIEGEGTVSLDDERVVQGHIDIQGELSPFLSRLVPDTTSVSGQGVAQIELSGTLDTPYFAGKLTLRKGVYEDLITGMLYHDMECDFLLDGQEMELLGLRALDRAQGLISGEGKLSLGKNLPFELHLEAKQAELVRLDYALARASGRISLIGDRDGGVFQGGLKIDEVTLLLPEKTPILFQTLDVVYEKIEAEEEKIPWKLAWDLEIDFQEGVRVLSGLFQSEWKGNTSLQGTTDAPLLFGKGALVAANFNFNGKNFESSDGVILFQGEPGSKTTFYITAKQEVEDLKVEIILKGPLKSPEIAFRSNPPKPTKEILSYLLLNRGTGTDEMTDLAESAIKLDNTPTEASLLDKFKSTLGIDRLEISGEMQDDTLSVEVGKYILPSLYFCLKKSVSDGPNQAAVVAKFPHHFKAQGEVGDDAEGKFMLKWEKDY